MKKYVNNIFISIFSKISHFKKDRNKIFVTFFIFILFLMPIGGILGAEYAILFKANTDCACNELNPLGIQLINNSAGVFTNYKDGKADTYSGLKCVYAKQSQGPSGLDREISLQMEIKCYVGAFEASDSYYTMTGPGSDWIKNWDPSKPAKYEIKGYRGAVLRAEGSSTRLSYVQKIPFSGNQGVTFEYSGETILRYRDIYIIDIKGWGENDNFIKGLDILEKYAKDLIDQKIAGIPPKNRSPEVIIKYSPENPTINDTISLSAYASDPDGDKLSFEWYKGIDTTSKSNPISKSSTCKLNNNKQGVQYISVKVTDGKGGVGWDDTTIYFSYYKSDPSDSNFYLGAVYGGITINGKKLKKGETIILKDGDIIETSPSDSDAGYAAIKNAKTGTRSSILPGTRLIYEKNRIYIQKGGLFDTYPPTKFLTYTEGYHLKIYTPNGTSGPIGTDYEVIVKEDGTSTFVVFDGAVKVSDKNNRKTVTVNAGQKTIIAPNGVPSNPMPFDLNTYNKWWEDEPFYASNTMLSGLGAILPIAVVLIVAVIFLLVALPRVKKAKIKKMPLFKTPSIKTSSIKSPFKIPSIKGQTRCPNCGAPLHNAKIFCNNCGFKIKNTPTFCPHCGKEAKPGGGYCESCGGKL